MKISIDKASVTLSLLEGAKQMAKSEKQWIDAQVIENASKTVLDYHYLNDGVYMENIVKLPELIVTVNRHCLTVWARECYVEYYRRGKKYIACLCFDLLAAVNGNVDAFIQTFERDDARTIED